MDNWYKMRITSTFWEFFASILLRCLQIDEELGRAHDSRKFGIKHFKLNETQN